MTSLQDVHGLHKVRHLSLSLSNRSVNDEPVLSAVNWLLCIYTVHMQRAQDVLLCESQLAV